MQIYAFFVNEITDKYKIHESSAIQEAEFVAILRCLLTLTVIAPT